MLTVSLRQMEYVCAISRHGGLTAAAAALNVSQPALSVALAQVEACLRQPLFLRRPGGPLTPTAFGRSWLRAAETQLEAVTQLLTGSLRPAPLRLAIFDDIAAMVLAPLLASGEGALVQTQVMGFDALASALAEGRADLAVTWDLGLPPTLRRQTLANLPPQAVLTPTHRLAGCSHIPLADLADERLALTDQGLSIAHMRALFSQRGLAAHIAHRCATLELMRSFAANALGVGLSYAQPAPRVSSDGRPFVVVPLSDAGSEPVILALPAAAPDPADLAPLRNRLAAILHRQAPPQSGWTPAATLPKAL